MLLVYQSIIQTAYLPNALMHTTNTINPHLAIVLKHALII